mmetsp:Transcript_13989/g.29512  ORF Transcript_13989/g.29512 Transcript_13989/m.29512 type:complete len:250 (-) Transcript_13989:1246-1995(-)
MLLWVLMLLPLMLWVSLPPENAILRASSRDASTSLAALDKARPRGLPCSFPAASISKVRPAWVLPPTLPSLWVVLPLSLFLPLPFSVVAAALLLVLLPQVLDVAHCSKVSLTLRTMRLGVSNSVPRTETPPASKAPPMGWKTSPAPIMAPPPMAALARLACFPIHSRCLLLFGACSSSSFLAAFLLLKENSDAPFLAFCCRSCSCWRRRTSSSILGLSATMSTLPGVVVAPSVSLSQSLLVSSSRTSSS